METLIFNPTNKNQINLLMSIAKELKIKVFAVKEESLFIKKLKLAGKEAKEIAIGKKKGKSLDQLLNGI